jgi:hypothetical protein
LLQGFSGAITLISAESVAAAGADRQFIINSVLNGRNCITTFVSQA